MQDPHSMVKARLLKVQSPVGVGILPLIQHLTSMPLVQEIQGAFHVPSTGGTNGNEPF
jgi:hypothetical protein